MMGNPGPNGGGMGPPQHHQVCYLVITPSVGPRSTTRSIVSVAIVSVAMVWPTRYVT